MSYENNIKLDIIAEVIGLSPEQLEKLTDEILINIGNKIYNNGLEYEGILSSIPVIDNENMLKSLLLPPMFMSKPVQFVYWVSRLEVMRKLIEMGGNRGKIANRNYITRLKRVLSISLKDNYFRDLPDELKDIKDR